MATDSSTSYVDFAAILDPSFSPTARANALVTTTNNPSDTPIDLSTPLSSVLFDLQEIDTSIHNLTTKSALPLLAHVQNQSKSSNHILDTLTSQISTLTESYKRLEDEVITRHAVAEEVRLVCSRLWVTVKIGRAVSRVLVLSRQLDTQLTEAKVGTAAKKEDHRAMVRASHTILSLKSLISASGPGEEGEYLSHITVINTIKTDLLAPAEQKLRGKAQQIVREFSPSSLATGGGAGSTFATTNDAKSRTVSGVLTLYLLSPAPIDAPVLLLSSCQAYLQASLTSSLASLSRALASLPTLPKALTEVSSRCQNIVSLELLLASITPPSSPPNTSAAISQQPSTLLHPLLAALDTTSLPSFFWRSLASGLSGKVQEILVRGGVGARSLRAAKDRVRESIREAVLVGCEGARKVEDGRTGWDREVGVMVGSVVARL